MLHKKNFSQIICTHIFIYVLMCTYIVHYSIHPLHQAKMYTWYHYKIAKWHEKTMTLLRWGDGAALRGDAAVGERLTVGAGRRCCYGSCCNGDDGEGWRWQLHWWKASVRVGNRLCDRGVADVMKSEAYIALSRPKSREQLSVIRESESFPAPSSRWGEVGKRDWVPVFQSNNNRDFKGPNRTC